MPKSPIARSVPSRREERAAELADLLDHATKIARDLLAREDEPFEAALGDPDALARRLELDLGAAALPVDEVLTRVRAVLAATPSSSSWRFDSQLFAGRVPVATVAELWAAQTNVTLSTFKAAGAEVLVERALLRHVLTKVGFRDGEACFAPGGSISNLIALLMARNERAPESRDGGVAGARMTVYTSDEAHYSVPKNAGIVGIGRRWVRRVAVDESGRMRADELARLLDADRTEGLRPVMVNATAGTTVRGAFDPLRAIAVVARERGVWLHVDGALGGSLLLCPERRELLDGAELADSFAWNAHKMMGVPQQCSMLLVARRGALARSLDEGADYLFQGEADDLDPGRRSIQCGRRNDALKLWAAWLAMGDEGWNQRLLRQLALARHAAETRGG